MSKKQYDKQQIIDILEDIVTIGTDANSDPYPYLEELLEDIREENYSYSNYDYDGSLSSKLEIFRRVGISNNTKENYLVIRILPGGESIKIPEDKIETLIGVIKRIKENFNKISTMEKIISEKNNRR